MIKVCPITAAFKIKSKKNFLPEGRAFCFMPKRSHENLLEEILFGISALFLLGGILALGIFHNLPRETRGLLILLSSLGMFACLLGLVVLRNSRQRLRKRQWRRAIAVWQESNRLGKIPDYKLASHLSTEDLRRLAIQVYSLMGYSILQASDDGYQDANQNISIRLINPEGKKELVHCKQWREPVGLRQLHSLQKAMERESAIRGFIWAPGGFSQEAFTWVEDRPIILADNQEIGRLVEYTLGKKPDLSRELK